MALLSSPLKEEVQNLFDESNIEYQNGNFEKSIKLLESAWQKLPGPKGVYDDSFHVVKFLSEIHLKLVNLDNAKKWSEILYQCDLERADNGQREYLTAKIAFESGKLDIAKQYFGIASKKSDGRCFKQKDSKYLKFFKCK